MTPTDRLIALATLPEGALPDDLLRVARWSVFDTLVVMRAGLAAEGSQRLEAFAKAEGGRAEASVAGLAELVPARLASLVNGAIAHAIDYDDTHFGHIGHVSVAVLPAALAVGEAMGRTGADVLTAFALGAEAACQVGASLGRPHYLAGFHQTATSGAFGATVAAGRLMGLTSGEFANALGVTATRASGLRATFGTMAKPLNAGIAAQNGVEAARLAAHGLTAGDDGVGAFLAAHGGTDQPYDVPPTPFLFPDNRYKLHACCHGLHAMIEALKSLPTAHAASVHVRTNPRWLSVCDLKAPRTGLEVKFSYAFVAALVLAGRPTAAETSFTDATAADPALNVIAQTVTVAGDDALPDGAAIVRLTTEDGTHHEATHDLADPIAPDHLERALKDKATALLGAPRATRIFDGVATMDAAPAGALLRLVAD
ncbi:MAG: MmgE/PrpD family protein [Pseudomonadota bacterium]